MGGHEWGRAGLSFRWWSKKWNKHENLFDAVVNPTGITDRWRQFTRLLAGLMACMALFLFEDKHAENTGIFLNRRRFILAALILFLKDLDVLAYYVYIILKFNKIFGFA